MIAITVIKSNKIYTQLQGSLLQVIIVGILKNEFSVAKTDKHSSFIEVTVIRENEQLAKIYYERVVKVAVDRYINVKTQRQKTTVDKLLTRVDIAANLFSKKTTSGASLQISAYTKDISIVYNKN
jgi:hypothetical protein